MARPIARLIAALLETLDDRPARARLRPIVGVERQHDQ
jgi:hypothetical protein